MPSVTQSRSESQGHGHSNSMLGNFVINPEPIKSSLLEQMSLLDELALETHLNFSQHSAYKKINLPKQHVFDSASKFCRMVAADKIHVLHALVCMVQYNVIKYSSMSKHYAQWEQLNQDHNKALWGLTKDLVGSKEKLAQSQSEFIDMLKEQDRLCTDLESAKA